MKTYVSENLTSNEEIQHQCKVSKWVLYPAIALSAMIMLLGITSLAIDDGGFGKMLIAVSLVLPLRAIVYYYTTELAVTNKRVISKTGFISRKTVEINITKLEGVKVDQGILGRICNYGSVQASGTGGAIAPIKWISNPLDFRKVALETSETPAKA